MSKPNSSRWHNQGQKDASKSRPDRPPHSAFARSVLSLIDGDYARREGETNAYYNGFNSTKNQKNSKR